MRVLILGPYPPPWGGVQTNVVALRDYLLQRGVTCAVINLTRHRREDDEGVYYPRGALDVLRLLFRLRYEVIHLHVGGDLSARLLALGLVCSALPWAKVVFTFHSGGYPTSEAGTRAKPFSFRGFVLRRFDAQIAVNDELATLFHRFGCAAHSVHLIPPHGFSAGSLGALSAELPARIGSFAETHSPLLVTVSGLEPEYDVPLQIASLGTVRKIHPRAGLVVVGSGSLSTQLEAQLTTVPHREHVLLAGDLPHADALATVARADIFLRTTWYDGDAISVREALSLGTPAIVTDNGMRPPNVRLIPVGDEGALSTAILEQLALPKPRGDQARDHYEADDTNLDKTLQLYEEILNTA